MIISIESQWSLGGVSDHNRYLAVVCTEGRQDTEESVILGIDIIDEKSSVGLVLAIWGDSKITLDGDGWVFCSDFYSQNPNIRLEPVLGSEEMMP